MLELFFQSQYCCFQNLSNLALIRDDNVILGVFSQGSIVSNLCNAPFQKASKILERRGFEKALKLYPILSIICSALWSSSTYEENFVKLLNMPLDETSESIHNFYLMEILISYNQERATTRSTILFILGKKLTLEKFLNDSGERLSAYVIEALEVFTSSRDLHPFALLYAKATSQNFNTFTPLPKSDQVLTVKNLRGHRYGVRIGYRRTVPQFLIVNFVHQKSYPKTNQFLIEQGVFFSWDANSSILYWLVLKGQSSTLSKQQAAKIENVCFRVHDSDLIMEFNIQGK